MKVEVPPTMDIHFCDLCNESVPEADLLQGRAVRRKGRVVCAACEAAMSQPGEPGAPATPPAALPLTPGAAPASVARPRRRRRVRTSGGLALLTLVAAGAGGMWLYRELERDRAAAATAREELRTELARAGTADAQLALALDRRTAALEAGLRQELADGRGELLAGLEELRRGIGGFDERIDGLDSLAGALRAELSELGETSARRLDELTAQLQRGRQDVTFFSDRLAALEEVVQGGGLRAAAAAPAAAAPAPAWSAALAELGSANAGDRWNAVQTLGESGDAKVVPHLVPVLDDEDVFVRMAAARVLGDLDSPEAIEPLIDTLEDEDPAVREMAMVSLRAITGRNFKFDAVASPAERAKKVKAWRQWWKKAQEEFLPGSGGGASGDPIE